MIIYVDVIGQKLKIVSNTKNLVSGSQNFVRFFFNLDSDWDGLTVFAQFRQGNVAYNQYLDNENSVYLPSEITEGTVDLSLYGTGGTVRATVNYLTFNVDKNIILSNARSTEISTSLYEQLSNRVSALVASPAGSGGDVGTELRDIRTCWDGTSFNNAADSVRYQAQSAFNGGQTFIKNERFYSSDYFSGDFNNVPNNKMYPIELTFTSDEAMNQAHAPKRYVRGTLLTFGRVPSPHYNLDAQIILSDDGVVYWRLVTSTENDNVTWSGWNDLALMGANIYINEPRFSSIFGNDFNNVPNNRIYPVGISNGDQISHSPGAVIKGTLITFGRNSSRMYGDSQIIVTIAGDIWQRTFWRDDNMNDYWTDWVRQTNDMPWKGLKLSVLGDSISTYPGKIPHGNDSYYTASGSKSIASVNSMWWKQLCDLTGATPLVIEAWSGTCCADPDYSAQGQIRSGREDRPSAVATSYVSNGQTVTLAQPRCQSLHKTDTSSGTSVTVNPDIIVVALGCNDYYYNVPLGTWDGHGVLSPSDTKTWRGAYANMILKIQSRYPDALIFCFSPWFCVRGHSGTSPENVPAQDMVVNVNGLNKTYQDYEDAMREICEALQCVYIDTNNFGFTRSNYQNFVVDYNDGRGETVHPMTHPNAVGQEILGQSIASAVRDKAIGYVNWLKAQRGA